MKSHLLYLSAPILCFFFFFNANAQNKKLKNRDLPEIFYKRMVGTMGKDEPIEMNISKIGGTVKGSYFHKLTGQVRNLEGEITEDGDISLQEVDNPKNRLTEPQPVDAILNLHFINAQEIRGSWEKFEGVDLETEIPLEASEMYPVGSVEFELVKKHEKYGDCGYSPCAEFLLIYPIMKNDVQKDKINKKINATLIAQYTKEEKRKFDNIEQAIEDFFKKYKIEENKAKADAKPMWGSHHEIEIICNAFYILTLEFFSTAYEGSGQPSNEITYLSFDLQTGNPLTLKDVLISGYEKELTQIGKQIFKENYGFKDIDDLRKEGFSFKDGKFTLNNNYGFSKQGIIFQYNPLEIGANAIGAPQLLIPYQQIKHLIKKDGLLAVFVKE
jgi:hypothetical protein